MIQFQVKKTDVKIGKHQGKTMYSAQQVTHTRLTPSALEARIERMTSLSRADVRSAIIALSVVVEEELALGRSVDLGELGTFKIAATGKLMPEAKQVTTETIRTPHVRFYPKKSMRLAALRVGVELVHPEAGSKPHHAPSATRPSRGAGTPAGSSPSPASGAGEGHLGI